MAELLASWLMPGMVILTVNGDLTVMQKPMVMLMVFGLKKAMILCGWQIREAGQSERAILPTRIDRSANDSDFKLVRALHASKGGFIKVNAEGNQNLVQIDGDLYADGKGYTDNHVTCHLKYL